MKAPTTPTTRWSTVDDVCKALHVSRRTVYDRIELGHIPALQPGKRSFFIPTAWLEAAVAAPKKSRIDWAAIIAATEDIA